MYKSWIWCNGQNIKGLLIWQEGASDVACSDKEQLFKQLQVNNMLFADSLQMQSFN